MRICVIGAGGLGCAVGAALASLPQNELFIVDDWREHVDTINNVGLTVEEPDRTFVAPAKAATGSVGLGAMDKVIIGVRGEQTGNALKAALSAIGDTTSVLSLQGGIGHEEVIAGIIGPQRTIVCRTRAEGILLAPGRVASRACGRRTVIGNMTGPPDDSAKELAAIFERSGLSARTSPNMRGVVWDYLLEDVATAALTAITRMTYGELFQRQELKECALAAISEGIAVAQALKAELSTDSAEEIWNRIPKGLPSDYRTPMLRDLVSGEPPEIEFINGAIVSYGSQLGIKTPVNATLTACVNGISHHKPGSSPKPAI